MKLPLNFPFSGMQKSKAGESATPENPTYVDLFGDK